MTVTLAVIACALILLYYAAMWWRIGRDPRAGTIVTQYEPPLGLSPAALRYLYAETWDDIASQAALLHLAVHGKVRIFKPKGYALERVDATPAGVAPEEHLFAQKLFAFGDRVELESSGDSRLMLAHSALYKAVKSANPGYFNSNGLWALPGAIASFFVVFLLMGAGAHETGREAGAGIVLWLMVWTLGMILLVNNGLRLWKRALRAKTARGTAYQSAMKLSIFAVPFLAAEFGVGYILARDVTWMPVLAMIFLAVALAVFLSLIKAPTAKGRDLLDKIEGFREFLKSVDMDAINRLNPVQGVPVQLHPQMPYAVALDVEVDWAEKFANDLQWVQKDRSRRPPPNVKTSKVMAEIFSGNWEQAAERAAATAQAVQDGQMAAASTSASPRPPGPGSAPQPPAR